MGLIVTILSIIISSVVIFYAGEKFAHSSSFIGDYLRLPKSVKGATFDAISSSLPEILVALYAVIFFKTFEVGVGTIAGSALFNLLVIPGIAVFVAPIAFKVNREIISRDGLFYLMAVFVLVVLLIYFKIWGLAIALFLLAMYMWYVGDIIKHTKAHQKLNKTERPVGSIGKEVTIAIVTVIIIGIATFFLTESSIELAHIFGISPIIVAFTITAAATSVPDTVISIVNAKKGSNDDAAANVFGSNVFDIFVGLGLPLLIFTVMKGPVAITFEYLEIVMGLLGATIIVLYFLAQDHILNKKEGAFMLFLYALFVAYVIILSLNIL